jgi:serine/threonine protein kinase
VVKAKWRGTEVAVKTIAAKNITKDMERSFREEVRVMTALRHPNVVLFMGASTSLPNLCIVMEYMTLGSLFDVRTHASLRRVTTVSNYACTRSLVDNHQLLHNDLIPVLPFVIMAKMAYQTARGMHFLHSYVSPVRSWPQRSRRCLIRYALCLLLCFNQVRCRAS